MNHVSASTKIPIWAQTMQTELTIIFQNQDVRLLPSDIYLPTDGTLKTTAASADVANDLAIAFVNNGTMQIIGGTTTKARKARA
jgi:hypothetical protein